MGGEEKVGDALERLSIPFSLFRDVGMFAVGATAYQEWARGRKQDRSSKVGKQASAIYHALPPEEKAAVLQRRFPRTRSKIEVQMSEIVSALGETDFQMNQWQTLLVAGQMVPREADIKVTTPKGHKVVILCDGEAFHGPKCIFGNIDDRIRNDTETAQGFFDAGYSVLRYSESEILSGWAISHVRDVLSRLRAGSIRVLRTWHPSQEIWKG